LAAGSGAAVAKVIGVVPPDIPKRVAVHRRSPKSALSLICETLGIPVPQIVTTAWGHIDYLRPNAGSAGGAARTKQNFPIVLPDCP
jgi:hypothetical protein